MDWFRGSLFSSSFVSMSKEKMMKEEKGRERHLMARKKTRKGHHDSRQQKHEMKQKLASESRSYQPFHDSLDISFVLALDIDF